MRMGGGGEESDQRVKERSNGEAVINWIIKTARVRVCKSD